MIRQFRDILGFLIPPAMKPKFFDVPKQNTGTVVAQFVYCTERDGLISIHNCKLCEKYSGLKQFEGVICKTTCTRTAPAYYNKKRYYISDENENNDNTSEGNESPRKTSRHLVWRRNLKRCED